MVRISGFHPGGPGSIPGAGKYYIRESSGIGCATYFAMKWKLVMSTCKSDFLDARWGYSSVVEHSTADREVPGSNPGVPCVFDACMLAYSYSYLPLHSSRRSIAAMAEWLRR